MLISESLESALDQWSLVSVEALWAFSEALPKCGYNARTWHGPGTGNHKSRKWPESLQHISGHALAPLALGQVSASSGAFVMGSDVVVRVSGHVVAGAVAEESVVDCDDIVACQYWLALEHVSTGA